MTKETETLFSALPPKLVQLLRDTPIGVLPGDENLAKALYVLDKFPSDTASAMTIEDWKQAWVETWQRMNRAEVALDELREKLRELADA